MPEEGNEDNVDSRVLDETTEANKEDKTANSGNYFYKYFDVM